MLTGENIGEEIKNGYRKIYGTTSDMSGIFAKGTFGMVAIAFAIDNLAQAISKGSETDRELIKSIIDEAHSIINPPQ